MRQTAGRAAFAALVIGGVVVLDKDPADREVPTVIFKAKEVEASGG